MENIFNKYFKSRTKRATSVIEAIIKLKPVMKPYISLITSGIGEPLSIYFKDGKEYKEISCHLIEDRFYKLLPDIGPNTSPVLITRVARRIAKEIIDMYIDKDPIPNDDPIPLPVLERNRSTTDTDQEELNRILSGCDFAHIMKYDEYETLYARGILCCNEDLSIMVRDNEKPTWTSLRLPTSFSLEADETQSKRMNMFFKDGESVCVLAHRRISQSASTDEQKAAWCIADIVKTQKDIPSEKEVRETISTVPIPARCDFARIYTDDKYEVLYARGFLTCNIPGLEKIASGMLHTPTLKVDEQRNLQNFFDEDGQPLPLYDYSGDGEEKVLVQPSMVGETKEKRILIWVQKNGDDQFFALEAVDTQAKRMNMFFKKGDPICILAYKRITWNASTGKKEVVWCVTDIIKTQKDNIYRYTKESDAPVECKKEEKKDDSGTDIDTQNATDRFNNRR